MRESPRVVRTQRAACRMESNGWRATNEVLLQLKVSLITGTDGQPSHVLGSGCAQPLRDLAYPCGSTARPDLAVPSNGV